MNHEFDLTLAPNPIPSHTDVTVTTFGYLHGPAPAAHVTLDLRAHFRDPHVDPALRFLTARDEPVRAAVLGTPGIPALIDATVAAVRAYLAGPSTGPVTVAVGCAGGRHRSAVVGARLAQALTAVCPVPVRLVHRDIDRPVVDRREATRWCAHPGDREVWDPAVASGGYVCAVPDPARPGGICGMPTGSKPCPDHHKDH